MRTTFVKAVMMRAMAARATGTPEVLEECSVDDPIPGPRDLLVEVRATSVNPVDAKLRAGALDLGRVPPFILGFDVSGVVRATGVLVEGFRAGDEVYAAPALNRDGANAEYVLVDSRAAARKPARLDHRACAALPLVALTAVEALLERAALRAGETALILGGGGGVGHVAVQVARIAGARVLATAGRAAARDLCLRSGADAVIDHSNDDVPGRVRELTGGSGCDVVFDVAGGAAFDVALDCVAVHGRVVTLHPVTSTRVPVALFTRNASLHYEFMGAAALSGVGLERQGAILARVAAWADARRIEPHVSACLGLRELRDAHRRIETGHTLGKIVLEVRGA